MEAVNEKKSAASSLFSRELSWIDFNERVLCEGLRKDLPPFERLKFLSIVSSNFDEFFMVRVAALKTARENNAQTDHCGLSSTEILERITRKVRSIFERQYAALLSEVLPALAEGGFHLMRPDNWSGNHRDYLESLFTREIFPLLTPLRIEEEVPLPSIDNYCLYAAFLLEPETHGFSSRGITGRGQEAGLGVSEQRAGDYQISIIRIPHSQERTIRLPPPVIENTPGENTNGQKEETHIALLEDLVLTWGNNFYPGRKILESLIFKVNRDADFSVDEKRDEDFIEAMTEVLETRVRSMPVRMVYTPGSNKIRDILARRLSLEADDLYEVNGPLNLGTIYNIILPKSFEHLKEMPWKINPHPALPPPAMQGDQSLWDHIRAGDVILHLPYQSFDPVVRFFQEAAADPSVAAIKTALYRTSGDSPIVSALERASLAGKHVTAVVELKARFDEGQNISWANRLEKAGVIVVYGLARLKIHAKVTVVMRREYDRIKRYVHLSTGNYNDKTAKLYEDISLFTAREDIAYDVGLFFNMITGYSAAQFMDKLMMAPIALKRRTLELIEREIHRSSPEAPGKIMAKMNALADPDIIQALYRASQAGVKVQLNVRGICMLVPGVEGLSENIRVVSIIDRYLEHSRIYYFANGGAEELYLASADWMTRNLERRVELMFPVLQSETRKMVFGFLSAYFRDNCRSWQLDSEGVWKQLEPVQGEKPFRVQSYFHSLAANAQAEEHPGPARGEFTVRRSPPSGN